MITRTDDNTSGKPVTIKEVAAACGVSKSTVSAALRNDPKVKPQTRERVIAAAAGLGYEPEAQEGARRLRMRGVKNLGHPALNRIVALMFPPDIFGSNHFTKMAEGAMRVLNHAGYGIFLECHAEESGAGASLHPIFLRGDIDAVIACYPPVVSPEAIHALRASRSFGNRPIVILLGQESGCHSVSADTGAGSAGVAKRLIELGHKRILVVLGSGAANDTGDFMTSSEASISKDKLAGIRKEFAMAGHNPEESVVCLRVPGKWTAPDGLPGNRVMTPNLLPDDGHVGRFWRVLDENRGITAMVCQNDPLAFRVWSLLEGKVMRVPEDMSIVGYDDSDPVLDTSGRNLLATVHLPLHGIGEAAGSLVLEVLESGNPDRVLLSRTFIPSLIERASLGPAPVRTS